MGYNVISRIGRFIRSGRNFNDAQTVAGRTDKTAGDGSVPEKEAQGTFFTGQYTDVLYDKGRLDHHPEYRIFAFMYSAVYDRECGNLVLLCDDQEYPAGSRLPACRILGVV